jgi:hypothetical protein
VPLRASIAKQRRKLAGAAQHRSRVSTELGEQSDSLVHVQYVKRIKIQRSHFTISKENVDGIHAQTSKMYAKCTY